jgi:hypothetical protein
LSHFRILNFGSGIAFAAECEPGEDPDKCDAASQDMCQGDPNPDPDFCPDPSGAPDECVPDPYTAGSDVCDPLGVIGEPDECEPFVDPDVCIGGAAQEDVCEPGQGEPDITDDECLFQGDTCAPPDNPDVCEPFVPEPDECWPGDPQNYDLCPEQQGVGDGDICMPAVNEPDKCFPADPYADEDWCEPPTEADECNTTVGDPDVGPTAVEMASFNAGWTGKGVLVEWETATEVNNVGFNLYRKAAKSKYTRLNAALIPCQVPGSPMGATYDYLDTGVQANTVYLYVLEAIDVRGHADRYGPVQVKPLRRRLNRRRSSPSSR